MTENPSDDIRLANTRHAKAARKAEREWRRSLRQAAKAELEGPERRRHKIDALDRRWRMSGSFESGKRR
jgi:hypothetical protein